VTESNICDGKENVCDGKDILVYNNNYPHKSNARWCFPFYFIYVKKGIVDRMSAGFKEANQYLH
jgi:hypothetical protein